MLNLSQRYIAALGQLSQFSCVVGANEALTHVLTGVQVAPDTTDGDADDSGLLRLTFPGGHAIDVVAGSYFELQLAEGAAHDLHAVGEGSGEIHKRAAQLFEHLSRKHDLNG